MNRALGITFIIISAASFGTLAIFDRYAYADGLDTFTLLFLRFTFSALIMAGLLVARREGLPRGKTLALLIGMDAIGYVGQSFCFVTATQYASAGLVALLLYLYPTFVAILSVIFLKEKLTRSKGIALALATTGVALIVDPQGGRWLGILLAIGAAAIYSVYIIVGTGVMKKVQEKLQPVTLLGGALILAAVILLTRSELRQTEAAAAT
jgi:drug/metabolite transporter (DMT)-like permease